MHGSCAFALFVLSEAAMREASDMGFDGRFQ